jgi:hypothetical protein
LVRAHSQKNTKAQAKKIKNEAQTKNEKLRTASEETVSDQGSTNSKHDLAQPGENKRSRSSSKKKLTTH